MFALQMAQSGAFSGKWEIRLLQHFDLDLIKNVSKKSGFPVMILNIKLG